MSSKSDHKARDRLPRDPPADAGEEQASIMEGGDIEAPGKRPRVEEPPPNPEIQNPGNAAEPFDAPTKAKIGSARLSDLNDKDHKQRRTKLRLP